MNHSPCNAETRHPPQHTHTFHGLTYLIYVCNILPQGTLSYSLHEVAHIIGPALAEDTLLDTFDLFLHDLDDVKVRRKILRYYGVGMCVVCRHVCRGVWCVVGRVLLCDTLCITLALCLSLSPPVSPLSTFLAREGGRSHEHGQTAGRPRPLMPRELPPLDQVNNFYEHI